MGRKKREPFMHARFLLMLIPPLVAMAPAVAGDDQRAEARRTERNIAFAQFKAEPAAFTRAADASPGKRRFELVIATPTTSFPDIARPGSSRLVECTIPRPVPFGIAKE